MSEPSKEMLKALEHLNGYFERRASDPSPPQERESADRERLIEWVEGRIESDPPQILGHDRRVVRLDMLKEVLAALRAAPSAPTREQVEAAAWEVMKMGYWDIAVNEEESTDPAGLYADPKDLYRATKRLLALYRESATQDP